MYRELVTLAEITFRNGETVGSLLYRYPTTFAFTTWTPSAVRVYACPNTKIAFGRVTLVLFTALVSIVASYGSYWSLETWTEKEAPQMESRACPGSAPVLFVVPRATSCFTVES